jgi:hypothetical protein
MRRVVSKTAVLSLFLLLLSVPRVHAVSPQFIGMSWDGQQQTAENSDHWDAIQHSGVKLFRVDALWQVIAEKGNWEQQGPWEQSYDKYFQLAAERDITLLPYLYGRRTNAALHQFYLSNEWSEWLKFVWTFVQRYGRGGTFWAAHPSLPYKPVTAWEVWNEPNLPLNNPGETVLPKKYAEFFVATSNTITAAQNERRKAGEPQDTKVLVGGLYEEWGVTTWSVEKYFAELSTNPTLNNEFKSRNSGYGLHPYSFNGSEAEKIIGVKNNVNLARGALSIYDSAAKPIWITELGWPVPGSPQHAVSSPQEQAALLTNSFSWLKGVSGEKNISYVAWYDYRDTGLGGSPWPTLCGLRDINGEFRPAWFSFLEQAGAPIWPLKTVAFQASNGDLWTLSPEGQGTHYGLGTLAGTNPGLAGLTNGSFAISFQANTGKLWTYTPAGGALATSLGMASGTSPAIAGLSNGNYEVAFQASNHNLWTYTPSSGGVEFGLGLAAETSPDIAGLTNGGYEVAFQANTHNLWTYTPSSGAVGLGLEMAVDTSPSIAAVNNGSYVVAFTANTGSLWTYSPLGGAVNLSIELAAGTSPAITPLTNGSYAIAFQTNTHTLWTYTPASGVIGTTLEMRPGTSPAVGALPGAGYEVAFQANTGDLWTYTTAGGGTHYVLGMHAGSSPGMSS